MTVIGSALVASNSTGLPGHPRDRLRRSTTTFEPGPGFERFVISRGTEQERRRRMFVKTILGATAAAFIAVGALGTSTVPAAAHKSGFSLSLSFGGPGLYHYPQPYPYQVCKPRYKKVKWHDKWGKPHFSVRLVKCKTYYPAPVYHPAPLFWGPGWGYW
jgi:hypothetical protein